MRKYDHLFFDLDNTLWDFTANSRMAMEQTLNQKRIDPLINQFDTFFEHYEQINQSLWDAYQHGQISKQRLIVERFSLSMKAFGIENEDWSEMNNLYLKNMAIQTILIDGALETLALLKDKGYAIHIITNGFSEVQRKKISHCRLDTFFTKIFISEEIKTTKPHRKIFEHALKSTNAQKKKSIMIGDSWNTDIVGARNFGIDQIFFTNQGKNLIPPGAATSMQKKTPATYLINTLPELPKILV